MNKKKCKKCVHYDSDDIYREFKITCNVCELVDQFEPKDIVKLDLSGYSAYEALEKLTETTGYKIEVKENEMERRCGKCKYQAVNLSCEPCENCVMASNFEPKKVRVDYRAGYTRGTYTESETRYHLEGLIKNVIFNDPATIVFWRDNTKTVVKCQEGDTYDPEKGLAMAICKKAMGNQGNYCNVFKKWIPEEAEANDACLRWIGDSLAEGVQKAIGRFNSITEEKEKRKALRDNLMVTAATRAVYMEADMDLIVLPGGTSGEDELANYIARIVDEYIEGERLKGDPDAPFDIYIEVKLRQEYGVKNND